MFFPTENNIPWLEKALDMSYRRHTVLASNVANADTPEYRPRDVEFVDYLEAELDLPDYVGPGPDFPRAKNRFGVEPGLDGNYVDVEQETVKMTSNRLFYELTTELVSRSISGLTYAIDEGGR